MIYHMNDMWMQALQTWQMLKYRVFHVLARLFAVDYPVNVDVTSLSGDVQQVTFRFRGKGYRGHLCPRDVLNLAAAATRRGAMKRPSKATDASGSDVTARVREYWGPFGDWNECMGLRFLPALDPHIQAPVVVKFNDLTQSAIE